MTRPSTHRQALIGFGALFPDFTSMPLFFSDADANEPVLYLRSVGWVALPLYEFTHRSARHR